MNALPPSLERVREAFRYDQQTGLFYRRIDIGRWKKGTSAGTMDRYGYINIMLDGYRRGAHAYAIFITTGKWPAEHVDHKNGDPTDNRLSNLREATPSQNCCNKRLGGNRLHPRGVSQTPYGRWRASITVRRKTRHIGVYATQDEAAAAYRKASKIYHGEFSHD